MRKCVYCLLVQECIIRLVVGQLRRRRQMMMAYSSSYHTHHHGDSILRRRASYERRGTLSSENSTYACPLHRVFVHVQPRLLLFPHARMHASCRADHVSIGSLQILVNVRLDAVRRRGWSVPLRHVALLIDEELAEIPLDIIEARKSEGRGFALHPLVKRMRVVTIHVHLIYRDGSEAAAGGGGGVPSNQST